MYTVGKRWEAMLVSELSKLLEEVEQEYRREEAELTGKQVHVESLRQQIELLRQLIGLRDGQGMARERALDRSLAPASRTRSISELVGSVLDAHGEPMHISTIRGALVAQGHSIPGRGTDANVIAHISRADSIVRVGKGMYALASWGLPPKPRQKRRTKKGRTAKTRGALQ